MIICYETDFFFIFSMITDESSEEESSDEKSDDDDDIEENLADENVKAEVTRLAERRKEFLLTKVIIIIIKIHNW